MPTPSISKGFFPFFQLDLKKAGKTLYAKALLF